MESASWLPTGNEDKRSSDIVTTTEGTLQKILDLYHEFTALLRLRALPRGQLLEDLEMRSSARKNLDQV